MERSQEFGADGQVAFEISGIQHNGNAHPPVGPQREANPPTQESVASNIGHSVQLPFSRALSTDRDRCDRQCEDKQ
jgi:hypothetical protein